VADRALEIDGLTKRYGDVVALDDLSFEVRSGEVFGFVGRNGAGKTTTMRIVLGVLDADAGVVRWAGVPLTFSARRRIGYMPEERGLYPKMRVAEQLAYHADRPYPQPAGACPRSRAIVAAQASISGQSRKSPSGMPSLAAGIRDTNRSARPIGLRSRW
jgi:ABC-2 type transport system ATP-binding protein